MYISDVYSEHTKVRCCPQQFLKRHLEGWGGVNNRIIRILWVRNLNGRINDYLSDKCASICALKLAVTILNSSSKNILLQLFFFFLRSLCNITV